MSSVVSSVGDFRVWVSGLVVVVGLCLLLVSQIGQVRLPDVYMRTHAAGLDDGAGAGLVLVGLAISTPSDALAMRLLLLALLIWTLAPVLAHLGASAAHGGGVAPTQESAATRDDRGRVR